MMIFLSGMYFEESKVDSYFPRTAAETTSHIFPVKMVIADEQMCTNQMLGIRSNIVASQLVIRLMNQEGTYYASLEGRNLFQEAESNLIIKYIQNSDGKKRI